jgi:hypothetical protein
MKMATFNKELHTALMNRKQFALASLVVDGHITDGKSLMTQQQANKGYFANKRAIIKSEIEKHQTKIMRHYYKSWLITKFKPENADENTVDFLSWENFTTC